MTSARLWSHVVMVCLVAAPLLVLAQRDAQAQNATPRAEWRAPKAKKAVAKSAKAAQQPAQAPATPASEPNSAAAPAAAAVEPPAASPTGSASISPSPPAEAVVADQSQEVLDIDFALAASIASSGPRTGYASALSEEGVLYDASGASPTGAEAAKARFATFPADVTFVRTPERALAAGGSGSSWGTYAIKRGETILSAGRYISVWRREASGWKMVSELAAGRAPGAPAAASNGVLPKRPASLGRATPSPLGVPLTVPVAPQNPASAPPASATPPASR